MGGANTNTGVKQYPVISSKDAGVDEYLKANPEVSGMAWGAGLNGSPKDSPRSVIVNPYNIYLKTPQDTNNLIQNERIRHQMDETKWSSDFEITPEQQTWSQSLGEYATNPQKLRETIVARLASNEYVPSPTQQQKQLANTFMGGSPTNYPVQNNPAQEAATYARLEKQGMSDQGIVSLPELKKEVVGTAKDLGAAINKKIVQPIAEGTANFFGRDASKPMSADDEIEMALRKSELGTK